MTDVTVTLARLHPAQRKIAAAMPRFAVLCAGRRFGKNILDQRILQKNYILRGKPTGWFAPTYRMLSQDWREIKDRLQPVITRASESDHRIEVIGGGSLEMFTLENPEGALGKKFAYVVINEAAICERLVEYWNIIIRPTLADLRGGAIFSSTPRGLNGFFTLWQAAGDTPGWARFHQRIEDNPYIDRDEIAAMRASLPARVVAQELDAEFLEDGSFFQGIAEAATVEHPDAPEQHAGHHIVIGVDWALSGDYTVVTVGCRDCARVVDWERFNQIGFTYQREKIISICKRWSAAGVLPERNSIGEPNIEMLLSAGLPVLSGTDGKPGFMTTATSKPALIQSLAAALEHGEFAVPLDYADELRSYAVEITSTNPRFSAPSGQHDDRVISLALTWWAMTQETGLFLFTV